MGGWADERAARREEQGGKAVRLPAAVLQQLAEAAPKSESAHAVLAHVPMSSLTAGAVQLRVVSAEHA